MDRGGKHRVSEPSIFLIFRFTTLLLDPSGTETKPRTKPWSQKEEVWKGWSISFVVVVVVVVVVVARSGYKLLAAVLLRRLKDGGAESRIWPTQFGFRSGRGTSDALCVARRLLEEAWGAQGGSLLFLALDRAKAFDSISPDRLVHSLCRVGIPKAFCKLTGSLYSRRRFRVRDGGVMSDSHSQKFGISQGCPLSPFLFSMVMTVLISDANLDLQLKHGLPTKNTPVSELMYADDTLVVAADAEKAGQYMTCIQRAGRAYGMEQGYGLASAL